MFKPWPKTPRIENVTYHFTEKLDGTNACLIIQDGELYCQSRNKLITPEDDNYGFARWAYSHKEELVHNLYPGYWYGEWWGLGIQRGYDQTEKRFSLFWYPGTLETDLVSLVPTLKVATLEEARNLLITEGSQAAPGFMNPEGVVLYEPTTRQRFKSIISK